MRQEAVGKQCPYEEEECLELKGQREKMLMKSEELVYGL